jgi:TRAP-type mannitol/chloroaromatic compound transport system permease small subunit
MNIIRLGGVHSPSIEQLERSEHHYWMHPCDYRLFHANSPQFLPITTTSMNSISTSQKIADVIDAFTDWCGRSISWLTLAMALLTCIVVVMRYWLELGSIALQETVLYLHATVFLLSIPYALKLEKHVRVDIFYRQMSPSTQALVNVIGGILFLLPVCGLIFWLSLDYVSASWDVHETSAEGSGLPIVYLLKSLLLIMPVLLLLQGVAEIIKNLLFYLNKGGSHSTTAQGEL